MNDAAIGAAHRRTRCLRGPLTMGLVLVASLAAASTAALAAAGQADELKIVRYRDTGLARLIAAEPGGEIAVPVPAGKGKADALDFLRAHGHHFGVTDPVNQLVDIKAEVDNLGWTHTTFQQVHEGIEVFSGLLKVHQNARGVFVSANGVFRVMPDKLDIAEGLTAEAAAAIAMTDEEVRTWTSAVVHESRLVIVDPGWYGDAAIGPQLAHHVVMADLDSGATIGFFIEARAGEVLDRWSMTHALKVREISDGMGSSNLPGLLVRSEGDSFFGSFDVDAAYDYYGDVYDYFFRAFGRDSIDDAGLPMRATVNSTAPPCPNAVWSGSLLRMVFCDGIVSDDVVGHELTHGVTQFTANLIYQNQSGQLNESFSDVFGELVDLFNGDAGFAGSPPGPVWPSHLTGPGLDNPNNLRTGCSPEPDNPDGYRWLMGEDLAAFNGHIRDMWSPPCKNHPDRGNSVLQTCPGQDAGGVHSGSGVPNHAFAMVTDGKAFNGYTVAPIGPIKAGAVWYRALTVYLTVSSDFEDAYFLINQAAADLIGTFPNDPRTGLPIASAFTASDAQQVDLALRATEMDGPGSCGSNDDVISPAAPPVCPSQAMIFEDDFEGSVAGWTLTNSAPPTPYNWAVTASALPLGRAGKAFFCPTLNVGNCGSQNESAVHSLTSPPIALPPGVQFPRLSFAHYINVEGLWDGGTVRVRVNNGAWQSIPHSACMFNQYNARLNTVGQSSTNPLAGLPGFTGGGTLWGTTIIDLSAFATGGDTVEIRFDLGKDGCTGTVGWYVDDVRVYDCAACDGGASPDDRTLRFSAVSGPLGNIGAGSPQSFVLNGPPTAVGDVRMIVTAVADMSSSSEFIDISINGTAVGSVFNSGGTDCPSTPDRAEIIVPAAAYNLAVAGGDATITLTATPDVTPTPNLNNCRSQSYAIVAVSYAREDCNANAAVDACETDCNDNGQPDECDIDAGEPDADTNGIPDVCEVGACCRGGACTVENVSTCVDGFACNVNVFFANACGLLPGGCCFGDTDGNGLVNAADRGFVSANVGETDPELVCAYDMDGNGAINAADRGFVSANVGLCSPLPDYQNGSGLNNGAPDPRFGSAQFLGFGTDCGGGCP